jgi:hypothetical protein
MERYPDRHGETKHQRVRVTVSSISGDSLASLVD